MKRIIRIGEPEYKVLNSNNPRTLKVSQLIDYLKQLDQDKPIHLLYDDMAEELHIYKDENDEYYILTPLEADFDENCDAVIKNEISDYIK